MTCLCVGYFKVQDEWYQPGVKCDFDDETAKDLEGKNLVKIIRTAMVEPPSTRKRSRFRQ